MYYSRVVTVVACENKLSTSFLSHSVLPYILDKMKSLSRGFKVPTFLNRLHMHAMKKNAAFMTERKREVISK